MPNAPDNPYRPINSTDYVHPRDPNLNRIENALGYRDGQPHMRVDLGSDNITIAGNVNIADHITVDNTTLNPVPVSLQNATVNVTQGTTPWQISGNAYANSNTNPIYTQFLNNTLAVTGTFWQATQPVSIASMPTTPVTGTVTIQDGGNIITVDGTVNANVTFPSIYPVSKDTNANSSSNRIYVSMETDTVLADSNYFMNVARGLVDTHTPVLRSAFIPSTPNTETSVWVEGGIYPFQTWTSASTLYIASDNTADTSLIIFIEGLNSNYVYQSETVTTNASNGTTTVTTTKEYLRIYKATIKNNNANSANAGEIRFRITSASGTVVAHIGAGIGVTKLSQYTIPAGFTGYLLYGDVSSFKSGQGNQGTRVKMMVRPYQESFFVAVIASTSNGLYRNDFTVPMKITEKSDIDVRVLTDSSGTAVSASYEMILIPN